MSSIDTGHRRLGKSERKRIVKQLSRSIAETINIALKEGRQVTLDVDIKMREEVRDFLCGQISPQVPTGEKIITLHISEMCRPPGDE